MSDTINFLDSASNEGTITQGTFSDTTVNLGTVEVASFAGTALNEGAVVSASFSDGAVNVGTLTSGTFLGTAINSGVVQVAEFFGTASNVGVIVEAAKFADTSSNVGVVSGSAIFADTSISNGVVEGAVQLGANVTEGENQALTETPTEYIQPNGFFPNAHYSGGSKVAPANYATVVHQVGSFWYKYDASGNGELASGNYNDGTSMFTFVNGVKGAAYDPEYSIINLGGSYYYYTGSFANGTVLYSDTALTTTSNSQIWFVDVDDDNTEEYVTTSSAGVIHITYKPSYDLEYVGGSYFSASSYLLPNGSAANQIPSSNDIVLVTSSMDVNSDSQNDLYVDTLILWGNSSVELYGSGGGYMIGNVKAYGETRIRNIDIYGVVEMFDKSYVYDAVLHGAAFFDHNAYTNYNFPGNEARIFLINGLYYENGILYTGTKTYGGDGYGLANSTFEYVNGVEVSRSI